MIFAGTPDVAVTALDAIVASRHELLAVVTRPDAPAGRSRQLIESPVAQRAQSLGLEVLKPEKASDPDFVDRLSRLQPDCCPVVAYGAILGAEALAIPRHGWLNLHFSVLPAWRGGAPVQRAIMAGDEVTGASVFRIIQELDAGPVFGLITERIRDTDTAGDLLERLAVHGSALLVDALDHLGDGDIEAHPQPEQGLSYAAKLTVDDARIDWTRPAFAIDRHVRGCTPAPGAWTTLGGQRIKLGPVTIGADSTLAPGRIATTKKIVAVGTVTTDIILGEIQPPGKKLMNASDWARGASLDAEAILV